MLFNSNLFLFVFLPVVLVVYWLLPSIRLRKGWSIAASYVFYGAWSAKFALLMLLTTSVDYFTAQKLEDARREEARRGWLALSLIVNLGVLGFFKYYNFFAGSLHRLAPGVHLPFLNVILPIGISFYTFESMSYTIDVYRREIPAVRRFIDYAHFITMFPRLIAGPIVRYKQMAEQLHSIPKAIPYENVVEAIHFFTLGLAKKVLLADSLSTHLVVPLFQQSDSLQVTSAWAAALAYAGQLYFDFSGYSDMAVGLGLLLGFRFPRNFNMPYRAENIADFWRRWHITLSSWLRDYLYIPLGGNRKGPLRTGINVFITMLLGGLWHGANWTFVLWGAYHGFALLLYRAGPARWPRIPRGLAVAGTFLTVVLGWVLFRSASITEALHIYGAMIGLHGVGLLWVRTHLRHVLLLTGILAIAFVGDTYSWRPPLRRRWAILQGLLLTLCITRLAAPSPFLYFQF
ncbi:MAG: MBOAT family protein [Armatimonadota bacterium]|nr:MBOAT family protein [Armatimonadota bacterium]